MGDARGFLKHGRQEPSNRPVPVRLRDWKEFSEPLTKEQTQVQASRCMDCGIPFCNNGCPVGNSIPDWNDLVHSDQWREALERLHATNNFPEYTGRLCPAPCEGACVLGIDDDPVSIKQVELAIVERGFEEGWIRPLAAAVSSGRSVAIVGSGPAGMAAAQQLTRAGHSVTVFERADKIGGLLRYGIPEFKMEKRILDRRLDQMRAEGTRFVVRTEIGVDLAAAELRSQFDAVVLAGGATQSRDLPIPGRELGGIYQAMEFLPQANKVAAGDLQQHPFSAKDRDVVIIGGGDTGSDCMGTAARHGARSVTQFEITERPPDARSDKTPWPLWPMKMRISSSHEESGSERLFNINSVEFLGDETGRVRAIKTVEVETVLEGGRISFETVAGSEREIATDMVLLAIGFTGPQRSPLLEQFGVELTTRGNVDKDENWQTNVEDVFVCGDMSRGQSLIVWAIAEGRQCAAAVDRALTQKTATSKL